VFARQFRSVEELKSYTEDAFAGVDNDRKLRANVISSVPGRLQSYINVEGSHFEYLK
jgi:hypothetical protein